MMEFPFIKKTQLLQWLWFNVIVAMLSSETIPSTRLIGRANWNSNRLLAAVIDRLNCVFTFGTSKGIVLTNVHESLV